MSVDRWLVNTLPLWLLGLALVGGLGAIAVAGIPFGADMPTAGAAGWPPPVEVAGLTGSRPNQTIPPTWREDIPPRPEPPSGSARRPVHPVRCSAPNSQEVWG